MRIHRLRYSPYARKVQILAELAGIPHTVVDVPYGDREALAKLTGGYIFVPVLELEGGAVIVDSRAICEHLLSLGQASRLVPEGLEAAAWGYHDFADGPLEDVLFRLASPAIRDKWESAFERALYVLVKERKFGAGCVDDWARERDALIAKAKKLLAPTLRTLAKKPFVLGDEPTLADAALYGQGAMLEEGDPSLVAAVAPELGAFMRRVERAVPAR